MSVQAEIELSNVLMVVSRGELTRLFSRTTNQERAQLPNRDRLIRKRTCNLSVMKKNAIDVCQNVGVGH